MTSVGLGNAVSSQFMLGSATVMIGPMADLFNLTPEEHGIGLVKNFSIDATPQFQDLTQGTRNSKVYSVMTGNEVKCSMEVYEYTAKNIAWGLGLDASEGYDPIAVSTTTTAAIAGTSAPEDTVALTSATGVTAGKIIMIQDPASDDVIAITKVTAISTLNATVSPAIAMDFPLGAKVIVVNMVGIGEVDEPKFMGAKVVGQLANGD